MKPVFGGGVSSVSSERSSTNAADDDVQSSQSLKTWASKVPGDRESALEPPATFCLAGTWGDWVPTDMHWDTKQQHFWLKADVRGSAEGRGFAICRGKAGKRWKAQRQEWK